MNGAIITIDGPSGSGKSTVAKALSQRLAFEYLDTGAMFRAIAVALLQQGDHILSDEGAVNAMLGTLELAVQPGRIWVNGEEVTGLIRTPEVSNASSRIAVYAQVRRFLAEQQRAVARGRNMICEGRDQGTVVFPNARIKFYLTASPTSRAQRRHRELAARGDTTPYQEVLHALEERDARDSRRAIAPLMAAEDALVLDTSHLELDEVLNWMEQESRRCLRG